MQYVLHFVLYFTENYDEFLFEITFRKLWDTTAT